MTWPHAEIRAEIRAETHAGIHAGIRAEIPSVHDREGSLHACRKDRAPDPPGELNKVGLSASSRVWSRDTPAATMTATSSASVLHGSGRFEGTTRLPRDTVVAYHHLRVAVTGAASFGRHARPPMSTSISVQGLVHHVR